MANVQPQNNIVDHVDDHKRVSFGTEKQMIVYDDGLNEDYSLPHASKHNTSFTSSDAPPNKVKVHSGQSQVPRPISPPAQIEELHNSLIVSPPLPSLLKKMENESVENPFRPTETLYHEVDPIVEAYRQRPFPPSPSTSPIPPQSPSKGDADQHQQQQHNQKLNTQQQHQEALNYTNYELGNEHTQNGKTHNTSYTNTPIKNSTTSRSASLAEARSPHAPVNQPLLTSAAVADGNTLPAPGKAEIVHINGKKKRCGCCSVQ